MENVRARLDGPRVKCGVTGCPVTIADVARLAGVNCLVFRMGWNYPEAAREDGEAGAPWAMSRENIEDYRRQYRDLGIHGETHRPNPRWRRDPYASDGAFSSGGPAYPWADEPRVSLYPDVAAEPGYRGKRRVLTSWEYPVRAICPLHLDVVTLLDLGNLVERDPSAALATDWRRWDATAPSADELRGKLDGIWRQLA